LASWWKLRPCVGKKQACFARLFLVLNTRIFIKTGSGRTQGRYLKQKESFSLCRSAWCQLFSSLFTDSVEQRLLVARLLHTLGEPPSSSSAQPAAAQQQQLFVDLLDTLVTLCGSNVLLVFDIFPLEPEPPPPPPPLSGSSQLLLLQHAINADGGDTLLLQQDDYGMAEEQAQLLMQASQEGEEEEEDDAFHRLCLQRVPELDPQKLRDFTRLESTWSHFLGLAVSDHAGAAGAAALLCNIGYAVAYKHSTAARESTTSSSGGGSRSRSASPDDGQLAAEAGSDDAAAAAAAAAAAGAGSGSFGGDFFIRGPDNTEVALAPGLLMGRGKVRKRQSL
jgi:hypothetical protein